MPEQPRILVSAYACEPFRGSEPGVGWNWVRQAAQRGAVWVITRTNNRPPIEAAVRKEGLSSVQFVYVDLPQWARRWKKGERGLRLYYYIWQAHAYLTAKRLHRLHPFDLVHHVTFVNCWMPSLMALLPTTFIWGPVGGAESAPLAFWRSLGWRGVAYEVARGLARTFGLLDPLVRLTACRAARAFATTPETAKRLGVLGCRDVALLSEAALPDEEIERLSQFPDVPARPFRVLSLGRLLHWKGFHLGIEAFARLLESHPDSEYRIVGAGPERRRLEKLIAARKLEGKVVLCGRLSRQAALAELARSHVLLHPSLHDSGGWVCLEAMAAGRPVVCLDLGGPGVQVNRDTGIKVRALEPEAVVEELGASLFRLAEDEELRRAMGAAGRRHVATRFNWDVKGARVFDSLLGSRAIGR